MKTFCIALLILGIYLWKVISGLHKLKESKAPNFKPYYGQNTSTDGAFNYSQYQPFEKIEKELLELASETGDNGTRSLFSIGKTFEGRDLWAFKISVDKHKEKKTIVVDCGAHAREWIAPATCMYLINQFSLGINNQHPNNLTNIISNYHWVFIPLLNPDGYVYTWYNKTTRLWRKNRSVTKEQQILWNKTNNALCIGVDINRNFDEAWGGQAAPINGPCLEMYPGTNAFSENESSALAKFLNETYHDVIAYVSLHSFGQSWMTPWGHKNHKPKFYPEMNRVAKLAVAAMKKLSGVNYTIGPSHDELYPNSGSSVDWAYSKLRIPYTYLVEMMPSEDSAVMKSFLIPPALMVQNAKDLLEGLRVMAASIMQ